MNNRFWLGGLLAAGLLSVPAYVEACPFCKAGGPTLLVDFNESKLVLVGSVIESKLKPNLELGNGTTLLQITKVLKDDDVLKGKSKDKITVPIYLNGATQWLVFCDVYKGEIDPFRGVAISKGGELVKYLEGTLKLKDASVPKRLEYCFNFLNSSDSEVSMDAYREFAKANYSDYKDVAEHFDADKIVDWLNDPVTPPYRYGLYASLLGHCGKAEHIAVLKGMVENPKKRDISGIDGLFAGYMFLLHKHKKDKDALTFLRDTINNGDLEITVRWTALKTIRFLNEYRPDILSKKDLVDSVALGLKTKDLADFAIEDLRRWQCWDRTHEVLELFKKPAYKANVIKQSILRFALESPVAEAKAFVTEQRTANPKWVAETEELLKLEKGFSN